MTITDEGTRIECPLPETLHRRDVNRKECWLRLYEQHIEYKVVAEYECDDYHEQEGIWKPCVANNRWLRMRKDLSSVDMYYDNPEGMWSVSMEFSGVSSSVGWLYQDPKEALKMYTMLRDYFISR